MMGAETALNSRHSGNTAGQLIVHTEIGNIHFLNLDIRQPPSWMCRTTSASFFGCSSAFGPFRSLTFKYG